MHERQAALIGAILALTLAAAPTRAEKDAATKAQEGEINHWIEYYRKNRQQTPPVTPAPQDAAQKEKEQEKSGTQESIRSDKNSAGDIPSPWKGEG